MMFNTGDIIAHKVFIMNYKITNFIKTNNTIYVLMTIFFRM